MKEELLAEMAGERDMLLKLLQEQQESWRMELQNAFARMEETAARSDADHAFGAQKAVALLPESVDPMPGQTYGLEAESPASSISETSANHQSFMDSVNSAPVVDIYHDVLKPAPSSPSLKGEILKSPSMGGTTPVKSLGFSQGKKEEKEEKVMDKLKRWINVLAATLVVLNSLVMMVELELEGNAIGTRIGLVDQAMPYEQVSPIFETLDSAFVFIFLTELIFRAFVEWATFLKEFAFWFDFFLVAAGFVDMYIIMPLASAGGLGGEHKNIVLLRLVRALKALRAIRMVRTLRLFTGLRLLVKACQCFLPSLGWSMVLLGVFMSMGALVLGTLLQDFILDPTHSLDDRQWVWMRYGTAYRALYTLYEITFAGNWPTNVRPVLDRAGHGFVIFFVVYITIIVFAVIRVISAIFLKDTLDAANNDAEHLVVERLRKKAEYVEKLEQVFHAMDDSGDGMITEERLTNILANPVAKAYFQTLDVDIYESAALFHLLDNGDGEVTLEEFIEGIMRCKGQARAIDQVAMRADLKALDFKLSKLVRMLKSSGLISTPSLSHKEKRNRAKVPKILQESPGQLDAHA